MGWACSIKGTTNVCRDRRGKHKGKRHLEDTEIDDAVMIKWSSRNRIEWVKVAQDRRRVVNTVIKCWEFLVVVEDLSASGAGSGEQARRSHGVGGDSPVTYRNVSSCTLRGYDSQQLAHWAIWNKQFDSCSSECSVSLMTRISTNCSQGANYCAFMRMSPCCHGVCRIRSCLHCHWLDLLTALLLIATWKRVF